jgi:hypothetical protein
LQVIEIVAEKFDKLVTQLSDLNFNEAYQVNPVTTIKAVRTVNAVEY